LNKDDHEGNCHRGRCPVAAVLGEHIKLKEMPMEKSKEFEGKKFKGGINPPPDTPRPSAPQGMSPAKKMHPLDEEYFKEFPSPIMEHIHKQHSVNINATIPFFGPMMYYLIRALRCAYVLEIGHAYGYTSWYMAHAVADNIKRFQYHDGRYFGFDIVKHNEVKAMLEGLPASVLNLNSDDLSSMTFQDVKFDLIFQDGAHDTPHVVREMEILYPQLKGEGKGYWVCHDCYGPAESGFQAIISDPRYNFEFVRLDDDVYGLAILRKMDNYIENKHWHGEEHV